MVSGNPNISKKRSNYEESNYECAVDSMSLPIGFSAEGNDKQKEDEQDCADEYEVSSLNVQFCQLVGFT